MNKYEKGQTYKIVSPDFGKCYIGSTTEGLSKRLARHKSSYHYTRNNNKIRVVHAFYCLTNLELKIVKYTGLKITLVGARKNF